MAHNIDSLAQTKCEYWISESKSIWTILKPEPQLLVTRIKDAIGVIKGEYVAVYFSNK